MSTSAQVSRTGGMSSITAQEALDELSLLNNFELVRLLEAWIKGAISFARTQGYEFYPNVCALEALKEYRQHSSWYSNYPWNQLPSNRHLAAMSKLVHNVCTGHSITESHQVRGNAVEGEALAVPGGLRPNVESDLEVEGNDEKTEGGDEQSENDNQYLGVDENIGVHKEEYGQMESEDEDEDTDDTDDTIPAVAPLPPLSCRFSHFNPVFSSESPFRRAPRVQQNTLLHTANTSSSQSSDHAINTTRDGSKGKGKAKAKATSKAKSKGKTTRSHSTTVDDPSFPSRQTRAQYRHAASSTSDPHPKHRVQKKKPTGPGHTLKTDAKTGEQYDAWSFERILDSRWTRAGGKRGRRRDIEYKIKWTYGKWTWQPSLDLQDNPKDIAEFHKAFPAKPGPPLWFRRAMGQRK